MRFLRVNFSRLLSRAAGCVVLIGLGFSCLAGKSQAEPSPQLSLSLRGPARQTVEVGEPVFLAVRLDFSEESEGSLELAPATGAWSDGVQIEIVDAAGEIAGANPRLLATSRAERLQLSGQNPVEGIWWFPEETMDALKPGIYAVRARLRIADGTGWRGESVAAPMSLTIVTRSRDAGRDAQRVLALAHAARAEGSPPQAAQLLDTALADDPDQILLLAARSDLALSVGNARAAFLCLTRASALAEKILGKPSLALHLLWERLALLQADARRPSPPAWSDLPPALTLLLQREEPGEPIPGVAPAESVENAPLAQAVPAGLASAGLQGSDTKLIEAKILADTDGKWASAAAVASRYGKIPATTHATGAPDVPKAGDSVKA